MNPPNTPQTPRFTAFHRSFSLNQVDNCRVRPRLGGHLGGHPRPEVDTPRPSSATITDQQEPPRNGHISQSMNAGSQKGACLAPIWRLCCSYTKGVVRKHDALSRVKARQLTCPCVWLLLNVDGENLQCRVCQPTRTYWAKPPRWRQNVNNSASAQKLWSRERRGTHLQSKRMTEAGR